MAKGWQSVAKPRGKLLVSPRPLRGSRGGGAQRLRWPLAGAGLAGLLAAAFVVVGAGQHSSTGSAVQASVAAQAPAAAPAPVRAASVRPPSAQATAPSVASAPVPPPALPAPAPPTVIAVAPAPALPPQGGAPLGFAPTSELTPQAPPPPAGEQLVRTASIGSKALSVRELGPEPKPSTLGEAVARGAVVATAETPTACIPDGLQAVLAGVAERFGEVTLVSTTRLRTNNHSQGSARHDLHSDCRAVDFKTNSAVSDVIAYLRTRSEVAAVETYRNNGVIHIDTNRRGAATAARIVDDGVKPAAGVIRRPSRATEPPAAFTAGPGVTPSAPSLVPSGPAEAAMDRGDSRSAR